MKLLTIALALAVVAVAQPAHAEASLTGVQWQVHKLRGNSVQPKAILSIRADGAVSGRGWCNAFGGRAKVNGNAIAFQGLIATMRACADARLTQLEGDYLAALREAARWRVEKDRLTLSGKNGRDLVVFVPEGTDVEGVPEDLPDGG
jgi:putative lipoprotein